MALTRREQKIMYLTVASVMFLIFNTYVLEPILDMRSETAQMHQTLHTQVDRSLTTLKRKKQMQKRWAQMQQAGLSSDVQKAESMVYRYLEESSQRSGLQLGSVQPDRLITESELGEIDFVLSGTGSMRSVTEFLWDLETAAIPLKIKSHQLGSKNEMAKAMTIQIELSTVYVKE